MGQSPADFPLDSQVIVAQGQRVVALQALHAVRQVAEELQVLHAVRQVVGSMLRRPALRGTQHSLVHCLLA